MMHDYYDELLYGEWATSKVSTVGYIRYHTVSHFLQCDI